MPVFSGTAAADRLVGSAAADQLYGLDGNDLLYGVDGDDWLVGGLGNDTMIGGLGNDSYDVDSASDVVVERAGEGIDRVRAWVNYQLSANVETLTLAGTADLVGTGNALDNTIVGNAGNNVLNGAAGNDVLAGGKGDDVYDVDSAGDKVVEAAGEGHDRVRSLVSFTLGANIEDLTLGGTGDLIGVGNALNNTIVGNAGDNVLHGGAGDDLLIGRAGDDVYDVDSAGDQVQEAAGEGYDRVRATVSYTLSANVEELDLKGTANIDGTGNALNNTIVGNSGANSLYGSGGDDQILGGDGGDFIVGGAGKDYLRGDAGDDFLSITSKADLAAGEVYDGGSGFDTLDISTSIGVIDLSALDLRNLERLSSFRTAVQIGAQQISHFNSIDASTLQVIGGGVVDFTDVHNLGVTGLYLSDLGNTMNMAGVISGSDRLTIIGGASADNVVGPEGVVSIYGELGNDHLTAGSTGSYLDGGQGNDILTGGAGADGLRGAVGVDVLRGGGGDDVLTIGGTDLSTGESLDGHLDLTAGDVFDGGAGRDTLDVHTGSGPLDLSVAEITGLEVLQAYSDTVVLTAAQLSQFLEVGANSIAVTGSGTVDLSAATLDVLALQLSDSGNTLILPSVGSGTPLVQGGAAADTVSGGALSDEIHGNGGNDNLGGGAGADWLFGDAGDDRLNGGMGDDLLMGKTGADRFVFQNGGGVDQVGDFSTSDGDKLVFEGVLHGTFSYLGASAFTASGNSEARFAGGQLFVDTDGNGTTDITVKLTGIIDASQLHASDFVFS